MEDIPDLAPDPDDKDDDKDQLEEGDQLFTMTIPCKAEFMEGCRIGQPTLRWTGRTGLSYLHCTEVGTISYYK
jgi:hypothetical protein